MPETSDDSRPNHPAEPVGPEPDQTGILAPPHIPGGGWTAIPQLPPDDAALPILRLAQRLAAAPFAAIVAPARPEADPVLWHDADLPSEFSTWLTEFAQADPANKRWVVSDAASAANQPFPVRSAATSDVAAYVALPLPAGSSPGGFLIVADRQPRPWTEDQVEALDELATVFGGSWLLRHTATELRGATESLHDLLERASDMVVSVAVGGRILYVNEALRSALQYPKKEIVGRQATEFIAPEYQAAYAETAERIARDGLVRQYEMELVRRDGSRIVVAGSGNCRYQDGVPVATRLFLRDITEQREVEADITLIEKLARTIGADPLLSDGLRAGIELLARRGRWRYAEAWLAMDPRDEPRCVARWTALQESEQIDPDAVAAQVRDAIRDRVAVELQRPAGLAVPVSATDGAAGAIVFLHPDPSVDPRDGTPLIVTAISHIAPIVERRRVRAALSASSVRLAAFLDRVGDLVVSIGPSGFIRYANRAFRETLGFGDEDLSGVSLADHLAPHSRDAVYAEMQRVMAGSEQAAIATELLTLDGRLVEVEGVVAPRDELNGGRALEAILTDVSKQRQAERELRSTEERLRSILTTVQDGILLIDTQGNPVFSNPAAARILRLDGPEAGGVIHKPDWKIGGMSPRQYIRSNPILAEMIATGRTVFGVERTLDHPDGTHTVVSFNAAPLIGEDGKVGGVVLSFQDITDQKKAEWELQERSRQLSEAQAIASTGSWEWDISSQQISASGELHRIFGVVGDTPVEFDTFLRHVPPADRERVTAVLTEALTRLEPFSIEYEIVTPEGETRVLRSHGDVVRDARGETVRVAGIVQDVTRQRRQEEELRQARDAAQQGAKAKSDFLANMSHEIRTPLTGILGMADLLRDTPLNEEQRQYLEMVRASGASLLHIIDDILDVSKVEAGKLTLEARPFAFIEGIARTAHQLGVQAAAKGLELAMRTAPDVPEWIRADEGRLRQVLVNLLSNAIKFTSSGEVMLDVQVNVDDDGQEWLHFSVRDTGIGIPEAMRERIFDPFTQADGSTTRRFGGTGLGLSISGQLVRLMGGRIWVESEEAVGSEFHFVVPLHRADAEGEAKAVAPRAPVAEFARLRVLIVEDSATTRDILLEMLRAWGISTVEAVDGVRGFTEIERRGQVHGGFDLCIIDGSLQGGSGIDVARRVLRPGPDVVMLVDSIADRRTVAQAMEGGVRHVLPKPVNPSQLFNVFNQVLAAEAPESAGAIPTAVEPLPGTAPLHILVAEDNEVNQRYVGAILSRAGHTAEIVGDGRQAVERALAGEFSAVLMDLQMPEMSGLEAARLIREAEEGTGAHLPIIALTAHALQGDVELCLAAGMDDYLSKPFTAEQLLSKLDSHRAASEPRVEDEGEGGVSGADTSTTTTSASTNATAIAELVERLGDARTLVSVGESFLQHTGPVLAQLRQAVKARDDMVARHAHRLRGSTSIFGAEAAVSILRNLEQAAISGEWDAVDRQLPLLDTEISALHALLTDALAEVRRSSATD